MTACENKAYQLCDTAPWGHGSLMGEGTSQGANVLLLLTFPHRGKHRNSFETMKQEVWGRFTLRLAYLSMYPVKSLRIELHVVNIFFYYSLRQGMNPKMPENVHKGVCEATRCQKSAWFSYNSKEILKGCQASEILKGSKCCLLLNEIESWKIKWFRWLSTEQHAKLVLESCWRGRSRVRIYWSDQYSHQMGSGTINRTNDILTPCQYSCVWGCVMGGYRIACRWLLTAKDVCRIRSVSVAGYTTSIPYHDVRGHQRCDRCICIDCPYLPYYGHGAHP